MVEINNQRKAFLDMLAWFEGIDNGRQKTRNHGYDVIVGGELFTDYPITRKLVTLNPNSNQQAPDATSFFSRWWGCPRQAVYLKDFSPKVRTLWHCSRLRSVASTVIDRGDIRSGNRPLQQYLGSLPGAGYGQFEHKADSLIKIQRSGRNGQRDWCMSRVTAIISALVICIIVCLSWPWIITDNAAITR